MKYIFVCANHEEFGSNGWRLEGQPDFDPLQGMAVAHDILEHFPHGDGNPADELQALGASLWLREGYSHTASPGENVGADLPDVMSHVIYENMYLPSPAATRPCEADEEIEKAFDSLVRDTQYRDEDFKEVREYRDEIYGWMRIGYRRVQRRFKGIYQGELLALFREIETEADRHLKHAEEGDRMQVQVVFKRIPTLRVRMLSKPSEGERHSDISEEEEEGVDQEGDAKEERER